MRKLFWLARLWAKHLVVFVGLGDRLIEYCHACGIEQPLVWWSSNAIWSQLTGHQPTPGDNMPGALCPNCFDRLATRRGLLLRWVPYPQDLWPIPDVPATENR